MSLQTNFTSLDEHKFKKYICWFFSELLQKLKINSFLAYINF